MITKDYLFNINRVMLQRSDKIFLSIGIVMIVLAAVFYVARRLAPNPVDAALRGGLYRLFLTIGLLEVAWFGFRYQNITFLGSHFIAIVILLVGAVWLGFVLTRAFKGYKAKLAEWEKEQVKLKYLPQNSK